MIFFISLFLIIVFTILGIIFIILPLKYFKFEKGSEFFMGMGLFIFGFFLLFRAIVIYKLGL